MKVLLEAVALVLLVSVICLAGDDEYVLWDRGPSTPVEPFTPGFEVVSYDKASGHLSLKFTITHHPDAQIQPTCDQLMMTVYPFDGITYNGPDTIMVPYKTENPYSTTFYFEIPPNDTSYLAFRQECDLVARHFSQVFVSIGDSLATRTRDELAEIVAPDIATMGEWDIQIDIFEEGYFPDPDEFVPMEFYPEMIYWAPLDYPQMAKKDRITGVVWVRALVGKDGNVRDAKVGKSSGAVSLDEAAIKQAMGCKYKPGIENGRPVASWVIYKVEFNLDN